MYTLEEGNILYDGEILADDKTILVDGRQDVADYIKKSKRKGFRVAKLTEGDYVMATPTGLSVGIEEKKAHDLSNSLRSRRLQRQLRRLEAVVDIPVLALRVSGQRNSFSPDWWQLNNLSLPVELLKWSLRGIVVFLPASEGDALSTLNRIRNVLQPGHHLFSIVAGTDEKRVQESSPFRKLVRRLIDGVGPSSAEKLEEYYEGNIKALLNDNEDGWKDAGLHAGQRRTLGVLLNEDERNSTGQLAGMSG